MNLIQKLVVLSMALGCLHLAACKSGWENAKDGYEVDPGAQAEFLSGRLTEDLGYSGFDPAWLRKAWVNGFQDHTYLFVIASDSPDLRTAVEKVAGTEPISSASLFRDGGYLGPSTAPAWWDTTVIDVAEGFYFRNQSRFWRFTWIDDRLYVVLSSG